jgi:hypothetical protein
VALKDREYGPPVLGVPKAEGSVLLRDRLSAVEPKSFADLLVNLGTLGRAQILRAPFLLLTLGLIGPRPTASLFQCCSAPCLAISADRANRLVVCQHPVAAMKALS